jgi:hypothetical protein
VAARAIIARVFAVILLVLVGVVVVASVWYGLRVSARAGSKDKEPPYAPPPLP